jgi:hypothetical protein
MTTEIAVVARTARASATDEAAVTEATASSRTVASNSRVVFVVDDEHVDARERIGRDGAGPRDLRAEG